MKYYVEKVNNKYFVIENKTGFVMKTFRSYINANLMRHRLNESGGFEGETPLYFVNKVEQKLLDISRVTG